jgi:hypothetical protein
MNNFGIDVTPSKFENKKKKNFFDLFIKNSQEGHSSKMDTKLEQKILEMVDKKKLQSLKVTLEINLNEKGLPHNLRSKIWELLIGNKLKINKKLFKFYFKKAVETYCENSLIKKDIDRTFYHFTNCKNFPEILTESTILLQMFTLYRPDIEYIQGMSYMMTFLLFIDPPFLAFKNFCNLVLSNDFLYKLLIFDKNYIKNVQLCLEHIISKNYSNLYHFLKERKLELWSIFWIEWMYALFLRTFDLETCLILWDFILLSKNLFIFNLTFVIFGIIDKNFSKIRHDYLFEDIKKLILENSQIILKNVRSKNNHEFDFIYIQKLLKKAKL